MKPGPRPAPTKVRQLRGDRPSRMPRGEPIAPEDYATPPAWLTESCREHWDRLYRQCQALGVGPFSCDPDMFQSLVVAADAVDRLGKIVAAAPVLIRNANGEPVPNSVMPRYEQPLPHWSDWQVSSASRRRAGHNSGPLCCRQGWMIRCPIRSRTCSADGRGSVRGTGYLGRA